VSVLLHEAKAMLGSYLYLNTIA